MELKSTVLTALCNGDWDADDMINSDGPSELDRLDTMKRSSSRSLNDRAVFEQVFLINHRPSLHTIVKISVENHFFSQHI